MTFAPWMQGGPSWLPQGQRNDPFGMTTPQAGGIQGLLRDPNFALALLANSRGQRFGQALGTAGLQASQMGQQRQDDALRQEYMRAQIQKMQQPEARRPPDSVEEYEFAKRDGFNGSFQDWITVGGQTSRPSSVLEWEHYLTLLEDDKKYGTNKAQLYLEMKRAPPWKIENIGGAPTSILGTPGGGIATTPLSSLPAEAQAASTIAGAKAAGEATGKTLTEAKYDLPRVEENARQAIALLDKIKTHPGLNYGVGIWSKAPVVPGTPQADFVALTERLQGKQFLEAYQSLKGGGQITEIEGTKAENAIANMQRAQSKEQFIEAANEFQDVIRRGMERARKKAGEPSSSPSMPNVGDVVDGYRFNGGNPADPKSWVKQ